MPIYCYRCPGCGKKTERMISINGCKEFRCECGADEVRDFAAESVNPVGTERGGTFWSDSLAISPRQAAEHRKRFPDVRVDKEGRLGFDSVKSRERYCDRTGFFKQKGRGKRRMKRIR